MLECDKVRDSFCITNKLVIDPPFVGQIRFEIFLLSRDNESNLVNHIFC